MALYDSKINAEKAAGVTPSRPNHEKGCVFRYGATTENDQFTCQCQHKDDPDWAGPVGDVRDQVGGAPKQPIQLDFDDNYPDGFFNWLPKNSHVYREFERRALKMARAGRKRYGARTIIEAMRYDSDIADSETTFKLNDHYTPGMARLWMATHSEKYPKFFEIRK